MSLTYTPPGELGSRCPDFQLPAADGRTYTRQDFKQPSALVIMFLCNHCPYVKKVESRILKLAHELIPQGAQFLAICSNDASEYEEDSFDNITATWREKKYPFPYLYDESQVVAKAFGAVCTPDYFVFDKNLHLAYRGRLDDSWKDENKVTRQELKQAVVALLNGQKTKNEQLPSMGCSIKWKG